MNSVTGSRFVAKCLNVIADQSFMNSVTRSSFVAKCSNILQDNTYLSHLWGQNTDRVISICVAQPKVAKVIRVVLLCCKITGVLSKVNTPYEFITVVQFDT